MVAAALAAGVVAFLVHFDTGRLWRVGRDPAESARADLIQAAGATRSFSARLAGSRYARLSRERGRAATSDRSPEVRIAAASIEKIARDKLSSSALGSLGAAHLVMGDSSEGVRALEASVHADASERNLNDLAAAYVARFEDDHHFDDLAHALDAAQRAAAVGRPGLVEAAFNRALALELSGLRDQARVAWTAYLRRDDRSGWAAEAREHLGILDGRGEDWDTWRAAAGLTPDRLPVARDLAAGMSRFAQPAREWLESDLADAWVQAGRRGDERRQLAVSTTADAVAAALSAATGDRMTQDVARDYRAAARKARLIEAHEAYVRGLALYHRHERAAAGEQFTAAEAAFRDAGCVQWMWAAVQAAVVDYQLRNIDAARGRLTRVEVATRTLPYPVLRARVAWMWGLTDVQQGRVAQAIPSYRDAARAYEHAGELENAGHVYNTWADTLRIIGEYQEGWSVLGRALTLSPSFREPIRRYLVFFNASLYARRQGLLDASLMFENGAVEQAALDTESPAAQVEARLRRAALLGELARGADASADLAFAGARLPAVKDATQAAYFDATRRAVQAEVFVDGPTSVADADAALAVMRRAEPADVPRLLLSRARGLRHAGRRDEAERSLLEAIDVFEQRRRKLASTDDRIAYLDHGIDLYRELAALRLSNPDGSAEAFAVLEQGRARTLFDGLSAADGAMLSIADIQRRLPGRTAIVVYSVLPDRLLTWVITSRQARFDDTAVSNREVARRVEALQTVLDLGASPALAAGAIDGLQELLIRPWIAAIPTGDALVIVPDGPLHRVPFAFLRGAGGRSLIADHALALAPSASLFVAARPAVRAGGEVDRPLLVGDLAPDSGAGLPALPESAREVREIAKLYALPDVLMAQAATVAAMRARLPTASLLHFAGHALVDPYAPQLSRLVLTPEPGHPETGVLYASDIARMDLRHVRVVLLAACETAAGPLRTGEGVISIARAFLVAGAPTVVATLWKVDDRASRAAFVQLHAAMRDGLSAEEALRRVQLTMQASDDAVMRDPRQWAGLVVVKVGAVPASPAPTRNTEG